MKTFIIAYLDGYIDPEDLKLLEEELLEDLSALNDFRRRVANDDAFMARVLPKQKLPRRVKRGYLTRLDPAWKVWEERIRARAKKKQ